MVPDRPQLPGILSEIAEAAGRDCALAIALAFGGGDFYVSGRGEPPEGIDRAAWTAFRRRFGGETLSVPLARRALVHHLTAQGMNTAGIAAALKITRRTVRRYRHSAGSSAGSSADHGPL